MEAWPFVIGIEIQGVEVEATGDILECSSSSLLVKGKRGAMWPFILVGSGGGGTLRVHTKDAWKTLAWSLD